MPQLHIFSKIFFILIFAGFLSFFLGPVKIVFFSGHNISFNTIRIAMALDEQIKRVFKVKEVLDGKWSKPNIEISSGQENTEIPVIGIDKYQTSPKPKNPGAIQMVLAFQLASGKTREDFAEFKKLDGPWVALNNGSNPSTIWTRRTETWSFDAFEDVTFASKTDFERAYAGNEKLTKAGEGLFGIKVLVAIVEEN